MLSRANQWVGRLESVARCRANKNEVVRGVKKDMAVPGLMYGPEIMTRTMNDLNKVGLVQNRIGRTALGANRYVGVEAIRGDAGWRTFKERRAKGVIRYKAIKTRRNE